MNQLNKKVLVVIAFLVGSNVEATAKSDTLLDQGKWAAAADQAAAEKDYLTAALALHRLQECPSADQPKGQNWNMKTATQGVAYARQALAQNPTGRAAFDTKMKLADLLGNQTSALLAGPTSIETMKQTIAVARESKAAYEDAMQLSPNDPLVLGTLGLFNGRGYSRGGVIIGAKLSDARYLTLHGAQLFNQLPDQTRAQQTYKAWAAMRLGVSFESLGDKNALPLFEASIKLGDQAGGAEGRCAANVSRVHLNRPVTTF